MAALGRHTSHTMLTNMAILQLNRCGLGHFPFEGYMLY